MAGLVIINILWEKIPFDIDFKSVKKKQADYDFGLYQIYGQHPAYGDNALLYIGKAQDSKFSSRLNQRWEFIESSARPTNILLGRIIKSKNENVEHEWDIKDWKKMIGKAETLLIRSHTPAFNKKENSGLYLHDHEENLLVLNWGERGALSPEVSTYRYSYKFWEHDTPLSDKN